ncbi:MAG: LacI family DNA-binding transcriptional regulator [Roseiflexaceae bacterium]|nr:LacI family transcriptional regulator [Roseiflexus sp.]MDW8214800.1 LacI family DNA-binding transcriptional regulator [Roseiflexaceae bacterium]
MKLRKRNVTIREVARAAGVSIQTVSNVMHNKSSVRPEIQVRVLDAIKRLGYYPSQSAQGLRQGASLTLGFLVFDPNPRALADPVHGEVIAGMNDVARANNYSLLIDTPSIRPEAPGEHFLRPFYTNRIDAAVITLSGTSDLHDAVIAELVEANAVFALLEREVSGDQAFCLLSTNAAGAYDATSLLIKRGRSRIAFIDSIQVWPAVEQRLQGYMRAMRAHGLESHIQVASSPDWTVEGGASAMQRLLNQTDRPWPDAVIGGNDLLAVGAMHAIRAVGLRIPDDIAVMGFDDFEFARYVEPAISTVHVPYYDMGRRAAETLIDHLQGKTVAERRIILPTRIILRRST